MSDGSHEVDGNGLLYTPDWREHLEDNFGALADDILQAAEAHGFEEGFEASDLDRLRRMIDRGMRRQGDEG